MSLTFNFYHWSKTTQSEETLECAGGNSVEPPTPTTRCLYSNLQNLWKWYVTWPKRMKVKDEVKMANQLTLRWERDAGLSLQVQFYHESLKVEEEATVWMRETAAQGADGLSKGLCQAHKRIPPWVCTGVSVGSHHLCLLMGAHDLGSPLPTETGEKALFSSMTMFNGLIPRSLRKTFRGYTRVKSH